MNLSPNQQRFLESAGQLKLGNRWSAEDRFRELADLVPYLGARPLGRGCFSLALCFTDSPDTCLKVSFDTTDGGPAYWSWCLEHQGEQHVPPTYRVGRLPNGARWVLMKKLHRTLEAARVAEEWTHSYTQDFRNDIAAECPGVAWAMNIGRVDTHFENIMQDEGGTWYVIDPLSSLSLIHI